MNDPLRRSAKRVAEIVLRVALAPISQRALRGRTLVLAYHNVVPDGCAAGGDRTLHLALGDFRAQLDALERTHEVVPLRDVVESVSTQRARPRVAITFDDAYCGAVALGLKELSQRGMPSTMFVTPGFIDGHSFWWDDFATDDHGLDPGLRAHALEVLAGDDRAIREWAAKRHLGFRSTPAEARATTLDSLIAATRTGLVTVAAHTWSHPNLTRVDSVRLESELGTPLPWLSERFGSAALPYLAYPYGLYDDRVIRAAALAGYVAAFAIDGGWVPATADAPLAIPRMNVPAGISTDGLALRAAGLLVK